MAQNVAQPTILSKFMRKFLPWGKKLKNRLLLEFTKMPEVSNCPLGENSPDLVTLVNVHPEVNTTTLNGIVSLI
jgi:hypothetical protein